MKKDTSKTPDNEITQSLLDDVYEDFIDSVLENGSSLIINFINNDETKGISDNNYVISKEIIPRISNIIDLWDSDFLSLIETIMRTIKVQVVADGNVIAQGREYDLRVFFVDKLIHESHGITRFRLALIESLEFKYFNHEIITEPEAEAKHIDDVLTQEDVSFLVESILKDQSEQENQVKVGLYKDKKDFQDQLMQNYSLLELKSQECKMLKEKVEFLEQQIRLQDNMYQKLFTELEKYRKHH